MITAEVALYPLKTTNASNTIDSAIQTLDNTNVNYNVNSMNTHIAGSKQDIFNCLENMFTEAENSGSEVNMVVTITNSADKNII